MIYDAAAGRYTERVDDPLMLGTVRCATRGGPVDCRPAFERYAALCRDYPPERVARITGVPAAQIVETARLLWERRPVAYFHWTGLEQHTNASQTVRAMSLLYALTGSWDAPGGNVRPTRPATNDLAPLALLSEAQRGKALGLATWAARARLGWATGVDTYRAILHGTPYPVRGMVGFGANLLCPSPTPAWRARPCHDWTFSSTPISFSRRRRRWPTWSCRCPRRGSVRACAWASVPRTRVSDTCSCVARPWRLGARRARTSGSSASWPGAWASAIGSSAATRTRATTSCWSRRA